MPIESRVNLIVAALDLQLVRMLRSAVHPALTPAKVPAAIQPAATIEPRRTIEPEPLIHARPRHLPEPALHPRPAVHLPFAHGPQSASALPADPEQVRLDPSPLQPPWKTLPWENPPPPPPQMKPPIHSTDRSHKGSLIDFFI